MNIDENRVSVFVGGGITKDSNAKKEWEETVSKSKVMKRVL
jgi:isochorismate synthase